MEIQKDELSDAVATLIKYLREDKDYFRGWKDNISIQFQDEFDRKAKECPTVLDTGNLDIHQIANVAAENFLKLLTYVPNNDDGEILYP